MPHLNAKALSWASLKVAGILSAMHGGCQWDGRRMGVS